MKILAAELQPPAYGFKKRLKTAKLAVLTALFGCQHPNPSIPFADSQNCPDCGAVRDYVFSVTWRNEYRDILQQWQDGQLSADQFAVNFHARIEKAKAAFIGEWRMPKGVTLRHVDLGLASAGTCEDCGRTLFVNGVCPTGDRDAHVRLAYTLRYCDAPLSGVQEGGL